MCVVTLIVAKLDHASLVLKDGAPQWFCLFAQRLGVPEQAMGGSHKF